MASQGIAIAEAIHPGTLGTMWMGHGLADDGEDGRIGVFTDMNIEMSAFIAVNSTAFAKVKALRLGCDEGTATPMRSTSRRSGMDGRAQIANQNTSDMVLWNMDIL